ncbi:MAG: histidine kinase dimerization/phospho-acceptor domain-containing protein, partial [Coriobacteriia bacterium]|nr:histidine kinase dimerization/phospho-acceptor domain-containing protein [Coriobacteriia bacterium]
MKRRGLTFRLAFAFAVVAVATALIAAFVITVTWRRQFEVYIQRGVQERADTVATVFAGEYERAGSWEAITLFDLIHIGFSPDLRIQILDAEGDLVAYTADRQGRMTMEGTPPEGAQVTARADIVVAGEVVGEALVAQNAPGGLLTERDLWFQRVSLTGLALAAVIAVALASLAGGLYARGIVRPIEAVTRAAEALRRGDRSARTGMSGGDPNAELGATFDQMADAVETERRFEQQLTADVAHELRTPLQAIQATVEAMQDGVLPTDEERLGLIHDETVRLGRLAGLILELSRLETGAAQMMLVPIDVGVSTALAIESSRALMESTGHMLEESVAPGLVVLGDGDRLTQAVGNLLANAARYAPEGSTVRVRVLRDGDEAVIEVADSGAGVAEEDRGRVFQRFWRADPARSRASGGLGIG